MPLEGKILATIAIITFLGALVTVPLATATGWEWAEQTANVFLGAVGVAIFLGLVSLLVTLLFTVWSS